MRRVKPTPLLILVAIILPLGVAISRVPGGDTEFGVDGSYYFQVARHVAEGHGLVTSVDLYHQGLRQLPSKTNIYPLWPLLLGLAGRVMPITVAARAVPRLLFILDLMLLYLLAVRLTPPARPAPILNAGHLAVLLFGCNAIFFVSCAFPYTEALAFLLLFASLLCVERSPAAAGAIAGLAFLTRSQMLLLCIAIPLAYAIDRRWRAALVAAFAAAIAILPWVLFLATFVKPLTPSALIGMDHQTPAIPEYPLSFPSQGLAGWLRGLIVAFNPASPFSFVQSFGVAALLVPIGAVHAVARRARFGLTTKATLLAGAALSLSLAGVHQRFFLEWLFGYRHGLPFILLLVCAVIELLFHGGRSVRIGALAICATSVIIGAIGIGRTVTASPHPWPRAADAELATWLAGHDPNAIVLSTNAQILSAVSRANFRWAACDDDPNTIRLMLHLVKTDYVAAYDGEQQCSFLRGLVGPELQVVGTFGPFPQRVFLMRPRLP